MTPSEHVGSRIKLYRKHKHLTLEEFSKLISRSPSTVSKYESGKIIIDVETLFEIAEALTISVNQLTDYSPPQKVSASKQNTAGNFFRQSNLFYMYSYFGVEKNFYVCALEIIRGVADDRRTDKAILYYGIESAKNYSKSKFIYNGTISYFESHVTMRMQNPYNDGDRIFIYAKSPFHIQGKSSGLLLGLSESLRSPTSFKVIFSQTPLKQDDELKAELSLSAKDVIADIRRTNCLMAY